MTGTELLDNGIKSVIESYPKVADILESYQIGCVPCQLGTCKLKDVVEIHNLTEEVEKELFRKISDEIFPGQNVQIPRIERKIKENKTKFSPPMKMLVDEHVLIKRLLALIPSMTAKIRLPEHRQDVLNAVDFIRNFADRFHHAKEEDLLFPQFETDQAIIQVMLADHTTGRNLIKEILEALETNDRNVIVQNLNSYRELLTEHIKKEDEILFPWMDRNLDTSHVGKLYSEFRTTDAKLAGSWEKYTRIIETLENNYSGS